MVTGMAKLMGLFLWVLPGLATMSMVICAPKPQATDVPRPAKRSRRDEATDEAKAKKNEAKKHKKDVAKKNKTAATKGRASKAASDDADEDGDDMFEASTSTAAGASALQKSMTLAVNTLKYHGDPNKNKKGTAEDVQNSQDLLA